MFAINDKGTLRPLTEQKIIGPKGEQASRQILELWSEAELKEWGIYKVAEPVIPEGERIASEELVLRAGKVEKAVVTEAIPVEVPPHFSEQLFPAMLEALLWLHNQTATKPLADIEALKAEMKK